MLGLEERARSPTVSAQYCPFSDRYCQCRPFQSVQVQDPLAPMLKALIASAEVALETDIRSVAVAAYDLAHIDTTNALFALHEMGIDSSNIRHVGRFILHALGIEVPCSEKSHHLVQNSLTVEYTRISMTALLWEESCGHISALSRVSSARLGHDAMQACKATAQNATDCYGELEVAFRQLCKDTGDLAACDENMNLDGQWVLSAVLVFGEQVRDESFTAVLSEALDKWFYYYVDDEPHGLSLIEDLSPDPAFAGSRAMAFAEWQGKDLRRRQIDQDSVRDEL